MGFDDVGKLSVDGLSHYLKILNLSSHIEKFSTEKMDGCLLQDLDEEILQDEFEFSKLQASRLMKFARFGYTPISPTGRNEVDI